MKEWQYYALQDGEYDFDTIKDEYHREVEVEQDGELSCRQVGVSGLW